MLGELLGALISAPVVAAAGVSKVTGDVLQAGAKDGSVPILAAAGESLSAAGEHGLSGAGDMFKGISGLSMGSLADLGRGIMGGGSGSSSMTPGSAEVSQSLSRAVEQPRLTTEFCVSAAELGSFAPSAVGSAPAGSTAIGM